MYKRLVFLSLSILVCLYADSVKCEQKDNMITCTYFTDRSDSPDDIKLKFHWISPKSPKDDRIKYIAIPPYYGSAYDYRFLPGRVCGKWKVVVTQVDKNRSVTTTFDINETEDEFFSN